MAMIPFVDEEAIGVISLSSEDVDGVDGDKTAGGGEFVLVLMAMLPFVDEEAIGVISLSLDDVDGVDDDEFTNASSPLILASVPFDLITSNRTEYILSFFISLLWFVISLKLASGFMTISDCGASDRICVISIPFVFIVFPFSIILPCLCLCSVSVCV